MKFFNKSVFGIVFILTVMSFSVNFISATGNQSLSFNYDYNNSVTYEKTVSFSDVMVKIITLNDSSCRYDFSSGIDYDKMGKEFGDTGGKIHKENLLALEDGNHKYYVKCSSASSEEPKELEIILRVNSLVTSQIILSEDAPINTETVDVKLIASKVLSTAPSLTYSFDGKVYNPLVLVGSEKIWEGVIVFDNKIKEGVLSFNFKGIDLEGRPGTEITVGSYFKYDRIAPNLITDINAESLDGEIRLEWYTEDNPDKFKIYRSELSNPDYTDYYKTIDVKHYVDTLVEKGKTYYYRVSSVDEAGNEGELSKEISGVNIAQENIVENGLNPQFFGKVESLMNEVNAISLSVGILVSEFDSRENLDKDLFNKMGIKAKLDKSKNDLSILEKNIEKYKNQALTKEALDAKINADRIKLEIIEKNIPNSFEILEKKERVENVSSEKINLALLELDNSLTQKEREKSVKETSRIIIDEGLKVQSYFYKIEVGYLDGNKDSYSVVKRDIVSTFEKGENQNFVEILPSSLLDLSEINFANRNYKVIKEGRVFSFDTDTKEIFYYIKGMSNFEDLTDIISSFVKIVRDDGSSTITGFSVLDLDRQNYLGIFGVIILLLILIYFFYARNGNLSDDYFRVSNRISEATEKLAGGNLAEAKKIYANVKNIYLGLQLKERKKIYNKIESLYNEILIYEVKQGLKKLSNSEGNSLISESEKKKLLSGLETRLKLLPKKNQEKVSNLFKKIKGEINLSQASAK